MTATPYVLQKPMSFGEAMTRWLRFCLKWGAISILIFMVAFAVWLASMVFAFPEEMPRGPFLGEPSLQYYPFNPSAAPSHLAKDDSRWSGLSPKTRAWFSSVKSKNGVPCCDIGDGHRTEYDMRDDAYWVPINGKWLRVPNDAVLDHIGNPVGDAVVWYSIYGDHIVIRCFVPGRGS